MEHTRPATIIGMATLRTRLLTTVATALVACTLAWIVISYTGREREPVSLVDHSDAAQALLIEHQSAPQAIVPGADGNLIDAPLVREPIPEEAARKLFPMGSAYLEYDPFSYYRYKGGLEIRVEFPEHEGGFFVKHTSSQGFGGHFDQLPAVRDRFIVITGDSHTDGLCNDDETFASRLQTQLVTRHPELAVEVLNTGMTGYSFYNYLGVLEKLLPEKPDAFVVAFYGGNDFLDVVRPWHYFHHTAPPPRRADYRQELDRASQVSGVAVANAFNQLLYFRHHPDQVEFAIAGAAQACGEIQRLCTEHGIALTFVYIPPGFDIDGVLKPAFAKARDALGLANSDLQQFHRLADKLIAVLHGRGAEVIDLRENFPGDIDEFYWNDLHINVKGHQLVADLLRPRIEAHCFQAPQNR